MMVWNRIHADFLMPSRLGDYARFLETALAATYSVTGIERFWRLATGPSGLPAGRYFVLRHDVDTDPRTAGAMWRIERSLDVTSSYFFRLSTRDDALMTEIAAGGGEVGYHYEEISTVAKQRRLRTREEALRALPEARQRFRANLGALRSGTGLPLRVAASHGDFVNRRLEVPNSTILDDRAFRREVGIELEGYDDDLISRMPVRSTDSAPPQRWRYRDPVAAIARGEPVIYTLVHPRHWRAARAVNARDDIKRLWEGLAYQL